MVPVVDAGDASQTVQVDIGIPGFERVERPCDQLVPQPQRLFPLGLLEGDPDSPASILGHHTELVRADSQSAIAHAGKPEDESDHALSGPKCPQHQTAVDLHRQEQLARDHVALSGAPDVATHGLACSKLIGSADRPDANLGRGHVGVGTRPTIGNTRSVFLA